MYVLSGSFTVPVTVTLSLFQSFGKSAAASHTQLYVPGRSCSFATFAAVPSDLHTVAIVMFVPPTTSFAVKEVSYFVPLVPVMVNFKSTSPFQG